MTRHSRPDDEFGKGIDHAELEDQGWNYVALIFVAVFVAASVWLVTSFMTNRRTVMCLEQGRHNCVELDTTYVEPARTKGR